MTAYNRQTFIREAIESVQASTYDNWELIIVDDCSKDETVEIVKSYEIYDKRIKVFINEINQGDYPNRNKAVSYAQGEYIMFCDSDDKMFPDSIKDILSVIGEDTEFNFAMYWRNSNEVLTLNSTEALRKHFFKQQFLYVGPGQTFMRRSFFDDVGGYPEIYGPANDMYFNLQVACVSSITIIPFKLVFYRRHDGQEINNRFSYMYNNYRYMRDALNSLSLPFSNKEVNWLIKKNKRRFTVHLLNYFIKTRDLKKTREAYKKAQFSLLYILQGIFQL